MDSSEYVPETPDISFNASEDHDSNCVIDSSLIEKDTSIVSNNSFIGVKTKSKRAIIESDDDSDVDASAGDDDKDVGNADDDTNNANEDVISSNSLNNRTEAAALTDQNQSYRDVSVISSRTPSPSPPNSIIDINSDDEDQLVPINISDAESLGDSRHSDIEIIVEEPKQQKVQVSAFDYYQQQNKVRELNAALTKMKGFLRAVDVDKLPDKGEAVFKKMENLVQQHKDEELKLQNMSAIPGSEIIKPPPVSWKQLEVGLSSVEPRTFGKQALETLNFQKALTMERLEQLHGSLKSCPTPETVAEDPSGLKVELMPHQKHALAWLSWRECQKPSGGILADDMGLGKTLTMISLTLKSAQADRNDDTNDENEEPEQKSSSKYTGGTLVVCPASLLYQWQSEIKKHVKKGLLSVELYHGTDRDTRAKRLSKHDIVITTYALVMSDINKDRTLFKIKWRRIILDEAHQVRNHKSRTSVAICELSARSRWALTGTPIHNKEMDLYSLLKFLRCSPFDDIGVWKRWVANKSVGGQDRLNTVMSSLLLRRTKEQLEEKKMLNCLPTKSWSLVEVTLEKEEMDIYQKILIFSKTLFTQYLHQRAAKDGHDLAEIRNSDSKNEYIRIHQRLLKLNRVQPVKSHEILMLLLRLRQICCHPSLITKMLEGNEDLEDSDIQGYDEINLLEQLNNLKLEDDGEDDKVVEGGFDTKTEEDFIKSSRNLMNPAHPIFAEDRQSSKMKVVLKIIKDSIENNDKIIVVSQWKKVLDLITIQLKLSRILFYQLDGSVNVTKRMEMVKKFNDSNDSVKVLLLSLSAGGVGLNLVGANRLLLFDLHWNPQLEIQAQDRIYRVGQNKPVKIFKLMASGTIEERIKNLQDKKLNVAQEVLTGVKIQEQNKLSLQDLKMLFNM